MKTYKEIYKRDSAKNIRVWFIQQDGEKYRTVAGIKDGNLVIADWTVALGKNVGRSNETNAEDQATAESEALYKKKLRTGYCDDVSKIDKVDIIKPMLATEWKKRESKIDITGGVWSQPKLDGMRCIARWDGLWTRTWKPITSVPHVFEALKPRFESNMNLVLDGELYNHKYHDRFNDLMSILRKESPNEEQLEKAKVAEYHVYDVPSSSDVFSKRYKMYQEMNDNNYVALEAFYVDTKEKLDYLYDNYLNDKYEGQMVRLDGKYENKRSNSLIKRKEVISEEFKVLDMEVGTGNWSKSIKRFIVQLPNGVVGEATPSGTMKDLQELAESGVCPDWATVQYYGYTPDGKLRFPAAKDWGTGKRND